MDVANPGGALEGIRVLDLGLLVQGPQAAQLLRDLGADVWKVELPDLDVNGEPDLVTANMNSGTVSTSLSNGLLGALSPPAHPGAVEAHTQHVANSAFHCSAADLEVALQERLVGHAATMFRDIANHLAEPFATLLVPRSCLRSRFQM